MKKIAFFMALCLSLTLLAGCGAAAPASSAPAAPQLPESLEEIMDASLAGFEEGELPELPTSDMLDGHKYQIVGEEEGEFYAGVPNSSFVEAIVAQPVIGAIPHKVVLLRAESAEAAEQLAKDVEANADPRWLICAEAEKTIVAHIDDVVMLVMSEAATADKIAANFQALGA